MECNNYPEVYRFYHSIVSAATLEALHVLKTDCFNEAQGDPMIHDGLARRTRLLEIDPETIKKAEARYPELIIDAGDIRALPYGDESFDLVLDLSTIDHVPGNDYVKVLDEYNRVLLPHGIAVIVVWLHEREDGVETCGQVGQYNFHRPAFERALSRHFIVNHSKHLFSQPGHRRLQYYGLEKK